MRRRTSSCEHPSPREGDVHEGHFWRRRRGLSTSRDSGTRWSRDVEPLHRSLTPAGTHPPFICHPANRSWSQVRFMGLGGADWGRPCSPEGALNSPAGGQVQVWMCERSVALGGNSGRPQPASAKSEDVRRTSGCFSKIRMFASFENVPDAS